MSVQNAASWGFFDCENTKWNTQELETVGFPVSLLPDVKKSGEIAELLSDNWHTIPKGTPIGKYRYHLSVAQTVTYSFWFRNKFGLFR